MNLSWESKKNGDDCIREWAKENDLTSSRQSGERYGYRHTRYANIHKKEGGTEIDHVLTNDALIRLQDKEGYEDNNSYNRLSDHVMQMIMINVPLMPRIKIAKYKLKPREIIDVKITKEKYVEGEQIKYTGRALKWQQNIGKRYLTERTKIQKEGRSSSEILRRISTWMYDSTYKSYKIGNNYWSMETAVLDTYERTLYRLQTLLVKKRVHTTSKIVKMIEK